MCSQSAAIFEKNLSIRPAGAEDFDAVFAIEQENSQRPYSRDTTRALFENGRVFVAVCGGCLVGYAALNVVFEDAELINIAVDKGRRGRGIGGRLLAEIIEESRKNGAKRVLLEVDETNPAIKLYQKNGFRQIFTREKYYGENSAVIMEYLIK